VTRRSPTGDMTGGMTGGAAGRSVVGPIGR
jgi:hypothetical protein